MVWIGFKEWQGTQVDCLFSDTAIDFYLAGKGRTCFSRCYAVFNGVCALARAEQK